MGGFRSVEVNINEFSKIAEDKSVEYVKNLFMFTMFFAERDVSDTILHLCSRALEGVP